MSTSAIVDLCDSVIGVADLVAKYAQGYVNRDKAKDIILKAGDSFAKEVESVENLSAENNTLAKTFIQAFKTSAEVLDRPFTAFSGYVLRTAAAALTVCEKSLAQYGA